MLRKSTRRKRSETTNTGKKVETHTVETVYVTGNSPRKSSQEYLKDERWDILPKTDYTYARSGSYSPRFFGRKYVNPNMSRYRIRGKGVGTSRHMGQEDVDYDGYLSSEYSEDERVEKDLEDSDSDVSYETVLEDGIELRSGKSLKTMKEILHEHDKKLQQSDIIRSTNRTSYTTSKISSRSQNGGYNENRNALTRSKRVQQGNQSGRIYSKSEQKGTKISSTDSHSGSVTDYSNVRARRNLNNDFSTQSNLEGNNSAYSKKLTESSYDSNSRSAYDDIDSRSRSKTVTTVTDEHSSWDKGVVEKGAIEASEKQSRGSLKGQGSHRQNNVHLYGLDSDGEFSDSDSITTRSSRYSSHSGSQSGTYSNLSRSSSTITTVITTITETIITVTRPVISPVWNSVGRPVWRNICQPFLLLVTSIFYFIWLIFTRPVISVLQYTQSLLSWLWHSRLEDILSGMMGIPSKLWQTVENIRWSLVAVNTGFYRRGRHRRCCACLPLLLLIPFLLALFAGIDLSSSSSAILGMFAREKSVVQPNVIEKHEYIHHMNHEERSLLLQIQSRIKDQLTLADVEAIVQRIMLKETDPLKVSIQGIMDQAQQNQADWKSEHDVELRHMQSKHDAFLTTLKELKGSIAALEASMASKGDAAKSESMLVLAGLEEKLEGLQLELHNLKAEHDALLARVGDCCHNDSYYQAVIKENVDAILAEMMAGHMSGNPSQNAFTEWLHTHYVSQDVLDKQLEDLSTKLTTSFLTTINNIQEALNRQSAQWQQQRDMQNVHIPANASDLQAHVHIFEQVRKMIDEALFRYNADKTGIADYALESSGGAVLSTRCSETFYKKTALVSVLGLPLWYNSNSPRTVIQPEVYPGQCWAFRGSQGYIVIQTSTIITPSEFTLEHIPKSLAPSGVIDSAPKDFTVLGLENEYDNKGVSLGNFTYLDDGQPMQSFPVQFSGNPKPFNLFELRILSNHGNLEYTCLYRFRIHGKPFRG